MSINLVVIWILVGMFVGLFSLLEMPSYPQLFKPKEYISPSDDNNKL